VPPAGRTSAGSRWTAKTGSTNGKPYYLRCRILLRIRRFLRPTLRRPLLFLMGNLPLVSWW